MIQNTPRNLWRRACVVMVSVGMLSAVDVHADGSDIMTVAEARALLRSHGEIDLVRLLDQVPDWRVNKSLSSTNKVRVQHPEQPEAFLEVERGYDGTLPFLRRRFGLATYPRVPGGNTGLPRGNDKYAGHKVAMVPVVNTRTSVRLGNGQVLHIEGENNAKDVFSASTKGCSLWRPDPSQAYGLAEGISKARARRLVNWKVRPHAYIRAMVSPHLLAR